MIVSVGPLLNKKSFCLFDDELLSTAKITAILAKSLPKPHEPSPSKAIPSKFQISLRLIAFFTNLTIPIKQLFSGNLLIG